MPEDLESMVNSAIAEILKKVKDEYGHIDEEKLIQVLREDFTEAYTIIRELRAEIEALRKELNVIKEWGHKGFYANKDLILDVLKTYEGQNITPKLLKDELTKRGLEITDRKASYLIKILERHGYVERISWGLYKVMKGGRE